MDEKSRGNWMCRKFFAEFLVIKLQEKAFEVLSEMAFAEVFVAAVNDFSYSR
jgi:hypothetical protein